MRGGRILKVRLGYNPNSSAESMLVGFALMGGAVLIAMISGLVNAIIIRRRGGGGHGPEDQG